MLGLAIAVLSLGLLASCSREATAYSAGIKKNFVKGCTSASAGTNFAADKAAAGKICGCIYDQAHAHMPFSDFKAVQDKLRKDHPKLLEDTGAPGSTVRKSAVQLASYTPTCQKQIATAAPGTTVGGHPGTTAPGASTTAPAATTTPPSSSTTAAPASSTSAAK